ncbi:arsenical pump-driving ATPase [Cellulomonas sp. WB94]|uniref:arsenical pump-driving ATPase n=1 Tax=Cellulomonas sp. WB94 TaxID=2173174 RepID=UPI000D56BD55|nr:arsenical pump-driving ATPase [Cellulomonas sp. WB94]PVU81221.1 arsenical pump-driving ATPase [Cellulomonas sp. WB94]
MPAPSFLAAAPRFLFFTGKGGVGKTSIACASALALTARGRQVLLVSTDPASNVGQVFGVTIGTTVTDVPGVAGLSALEIDPEQTAATYRERIVGPVRGLLPDADVRAIEEQLSGACTTEIASFNEFTALLADPAATDGYDHVIFDTAPTGHTLRLLQLPGEWTGFLEEGKGDASCLGPLAGLEKQKAAYADAVSALADPDRTLLLLVARAQRSAIDEVASTHSELDAIGLSHQHLVLNGLMPRPDDSSDELARAVYEREQAVLADLPPAVKVLPTDRIELNAATMVGLVALRQLFEPAHLDQSPVPEMPVAAGSLALADLVAEIAAQDHGLVMLMGKGGVGKTTLAAAVAVALADRGHDVHLTTTDPAAHLSQTLVGAVDRLTVSRIDPSVETAAYRDRVLRTKGASLDDQGRAMLTEDLRSPCTQEIAVFQAFSRVVHEATRSFVVMDTAPTGHTLLLLDATGSYHRDVARQLGPTGHFTTPMMRLQDPGHTKVIVVTVAEATPVQEATELAGDLERAGIRPWAWVVNDSLAAAGPSSALLRRRAAAELPEIEKVRSRTPRTVVVPLLAREPVGIPALRALAGQSLLTEPTHR